MNSSQALRNCSRGAASQRMPRPGVSVRLGGDAGRIETGCRDRIRTGDLRGMNPVSCLCSTLLRNGWSVMVRRRRSSLTRRGTDGRFCICDFKHQGSRWAVNVGPEIVPRYASDTLDCKDMLRGNLIPLRNGAPSDFTLACYLSEFGCLLKSVGKLDHRSLLIAG